MNMQKKSLIVVSIDDSDLSTEIIEKICTTHNITIISANSGQDGLHKVNNLIANQEEIACILLDIKMPEMDGITVLKQLKADDGTKKIPVVIVTGINDEDKIGEAHKYGAVDIIFKPFDKTAFLEKIKVYL